MDLALYNHLIIKEILSYLPLPDLQRCSIVNKTWNAIARPFIQKSRRRVLTLNHEDDGVEIRNLTKVLRSSSSLPYDGLSIIYKAGIPPKRPYWVPEIEARVAHEWDEFIEILTEKLPNLTFIRLNTGPYPSPATLVAVQQVLQAYASKLTRIGVTSDWFIRSAVIWNRAHLIKEIIFAASSKDIDALQRLASMRPVLEKLWFSSMLQVGGALRTEICSKYPNQFGDLLVQLMQSSAESLIDLSVDLNDILQLIFSNQLPVNSSLMRLTLIIDQYFVGKEGRGAVGLVDFSRYFPGVRHIKFWFASGFSECRPTMQTFPMQFICDTVTRISFEAQGGTASARPMFIEESSRYFRNVREISFVNPVTDSNLWVTFWRTLWEFWSDVEVISLVNVPVSVLNVSWDFAFVGTASGDSHFYCNPRWISMLRMRNLKRIDLEVNYSREMNFRLPANPGLTCLSENAAAGVFSQMPDFGFRIFRTGHERPHPTNYFNLDHLAKFTTIETYDGPIHGLID